MAKLIAIFETHKGLLLKVFGGIFIVAALALGYRYLTRPGTTAIEKAQEESAKMIAAQKRAKARALLQTQVALPSATPAQVAQVAPVAATTSPSPSPVKSMATFSQMDDPLLPARAKRVRVGALINRRQLATAKIFADVNTTMGTFTIKLLHHRAPRTVENFIDLVEGTKRNPYILSSEFQGEPFYDGLLIFRTAANTFIQTGDVANTGRGASYFIDSEANTASADVEEGMVAMAQLGRQTSGTQFYVALTNMGDLLDAVNVVFGQISAGLDVVKKISAVKVDIYERPLTEVKIKHITLRQM